MLIVCGLWPAVAPWWPVGGLPVCFCAVCCVATGAGNDFHCFTNQCYVALLLLDSFFMWCADVRVDVDVRVLCVRVVHVRTFPCAT